MTNPQRFVNGVSSGGRNRPVSFLPVPDPTRWSYEASNFVTGPAIAASGNSSNWHVTVIGTSAIAPGVMATGAGTVHPIAGALVQVPVTSTNGVVLGSPIAAGNARGNSLTLRKGKKVVLAMGFAVDTAVLNKQFQIGLCAAATTTPSNTAVGIYMISDANGVVTCQIRGSATAALPKTFTIVPLVHYTVQLRWDKGVLTGGYRGRVAISGADTGFVSLGSVSTASIGNTFDTSGATTVGAVNPHLSIQNTGTATAGTACFSHFLYAVER